MCVSTVTWCQSHNKQMSSLLKRAIRLCESLSAFAYSAPYSAQHSPPMSWQANTFLLLVSGHFKVTHYANDEFFRGYIFSLAVWRKAERHSIDFPPLVPSGCFETLIPLLTVCAIAKNTDEKHCRLPTLQSKLYRM